MGAFDEEEGADEVCALGVQTPSLKVVPHPQAVAGQHAER